MQRQAIEVNAEDDEAIQIDSGFGHSAEGGLNEARVRKQSDNIHERGRLPPIINQT